MFVPFGVAKPKKGFFDAVAADIEGFDKSRALIIGDSLTSDIKGGINAGLDTCWYNPKGKPVPTDLPVTFVINDLAQLPGLVEKGSL